MKNTIKQNVAAFTVTVFALSFFVGSVNVVAAADLGGFDDYGGFEYDYGFDDYGGFNYDDNAFVYEPNDYAYTYEPFYGYEDDYAYTYEPFYEDYAYTYEPFYEEYVEYDYYTPSYSSGGGFDWGCGSWCGGGGYSYTPPRYTPPVVTQPGHSSYSNVVTNTNVNNISNTNIDNSIRDSFNNYNSNNVIAVAAPQTPVVYNPPVYTNPAPYCYISSSQAHYGSGAYLAWSSTNATSAYLSHVGSVGVSGSQTVYPGSGATYTLTVYGYNGQSATCSTWVSGTMYVPPVVHQPYVALTQIPYTGFDLGPIGNAMYWVALMSFAVAGAYLMVYYRGGALALATAMVPARRQKFAPVVAPKAPILVEKEAAVAARVAPVVASIRKSGTTDTMAIVDRKDGSMPKIVINRG